MACRDAVAGDNQRTLTLQRPCRPALRGSPHEFLYFPSRIILCHTMLVTQNKTNSCHQFRRHMERISPGSTDSCRIVEQLMSRADVPNSLQCQRSLIIAGDGATPSRHLLNYPRLRCLLCLRCLLLLVGPKWTTIIHTTNSQCVLYIKAGVANVAGAWFIHRPVRGLYRPCSTRVE